MVTINIDNGVCHILLVRPDKKNALTLDMYQAMADTINQACADQTVKVIVISGEGGNYTAGNDLADFLANPSVDESSAVYQFLMAILLCKLPVVAAVDGFCIGIGCTMLLHFEQVFAAKNAQFALPFASLGLVPEAGSSALLPKLVGYQKAAKWLLSGDPFSAQEAYDAGLVAELTAAGEALPAAMAFASKLAKKPRSVLVESKRLMRSDEQPLKERMDEELLSFVQFLSAPAAKEALTAFMEKRAPDFSNL